MNEIFQIEPIGYASTDYTDAYYKADENGKRNYTKAKITMLDKYKIGIKDLKKDMFITIIFYFNKSKEYNMVSPTCYSKEPLGIFSSRSPRRPNHLGITSSKILEITENTIVIETSDMIDGTPIIDIKLGK
ncbi:MAG: TrmO family methyltransferase [Sphaerochaetaceae bacterium]|nr:TrmO family methyltransferase [Sphaerochaetaceae bacterium]